MLAPDQEGEKYAIGDCVRLLKDIKNDGTFPYAKIGEILASSGSIGYVRKVGYFLQDIRVYEIDFVEIGLIFGCREHELELAE